MKQSRFGLLIISVMFVQLSFAQDRNIIEPINADYNLTGYPQHATLMGWNERMMMQMLDRSNGPGGLINDRGWMYNYGKYIGDEFTLNRMTFTPTMNDDYIWYRSPNAARFTLADYDDLEAITLTEMQYQVDFKPKHQIIVWGYMERNPVFNRAFINLAYQYELKKDTYVGVKHTIGSKQVDMDVSVFTQMGNPQTGYVRVEATAADYLNNFVESGVEQSNVYSDSVRKFSEFPFMASISAVSPMIKNFRAELFATYQTPSVAKVYSLEAPLVSYGYSQEGWFAGGLFEYKTEIITIGSVYKMLYSKSSRDSSGTSAINPQYVNSQLEVHKGFYLIANASQITWDSWIWLVDYEEIQEGARYDILADIGRDFQQNENRFFIHNRLYVRPDYSGFLFGIEHLADLRSKKTSIPNNDGTVLVPNDFDPIADVFPSYFKDNNNRILFVLGYQFHPRANVQIGYGLDLDNDLHNTLNGQRYDTAFLRIDLRW